MSMPITEPVIPPSDFDLFLEEVGIGFLPQEQRDGIADRLREASSYMTVNLIRQRLTDEQQVELANLMDRAVETDDHTEVNAFLLQAIPDIETLADDAVRWAKQELRASLRDLPKLTAMYQAVARGELSLDELLRSDTNNQEKVFGTATDTAAETAPPEASFNAAMDATDTPPVNPAPVAPSESSQAAIEDELQSIQQAPLPPQDQNQP